MRRSFLWPDGAGGSPRTKVLRKSAAREVAGEGVQTFPRLRLENINSHHSILFAATIGLDAPGAASWSFAQLSMFAVRQNNGCHAEANGRSHRQAKQDG